MGILVLNQQTLVLTSLLACVAQGAAAQGACSTEIVRGTVTVERSGQVLELAAGDTLYSGDLVATGTDGFAQFGNDAYSLFAHWGFYQSVEINDWFCPSAPVIEASTPAPVQTPEFYVVSVSGEEGAVTVQRGGEVRVLSQGDALQPGDKIITQSGAATEVFAYGCNVQVPAEALLTINPTMCSAGPVTIAQQTPAPPVNPTPVVTAGSPGVNAPLLIGAGLLGAGAIAALASGGDDDNNDTPASP